ncbi:MAG: hypothetical protein ACTSV5_05580 [Promethearchaeota archaeon]
MIQEIIILSNDGIPLFQHNFLDNSNSDPNFQIIASYFDQICRFAKYGFQESIDSLKLNKSIFYFHTHPISRVHLIIKTDSKTDSRRSKRKMLNLKANYILNQFVTKYKSFLENFDGNVTRFKSFSKDLENLDKLMDNNQLIY